MASTSSSSQQPPPGPPPPLLSLLYRLEQKNLVTPLHPFALLPHHTILNSTPLRQHVDNQPVELINWNNDKEETKTFVFSYSSSPNDKYTLKIILLTEDDVALTLVREGGDKKSSSGQDKSSAARTFKLSDYVRVLENYQEKGLNEVYVLERVQEFDREFKEGILVPMGIIEEEIQVKKGPYDDKNDKKKEEDKKDKRRVGVEDDVPPYYMPEPEPSPLFIPPVGGPGLYGRSDLDPLGRFGAGNIIDPRGLRGRNPGGVIRPPPGARFDPFGPPDPSRPDDLGGRFGLPNPDHERPFGGDYDDMFM